MADDIIEPEVTVSPQGEIAIPDTPGRGYEVRTDLIEKLTVRKETIRAMALVALTETHDLVALHLPALMCDSERQAPLQ